MVLGIGEGLVREDECKRAQPDGDLAILDGKRQRYQYYGYSKDGAMFYYNINAGLAGFSAAMVIFPFSTHKPIFLPWRERQHFHARSLKANELNAKEMSPDNGYARRGWRTW